MSAMDSREMGFPAFGRKKKRKYIKEMKWKMNNDTSI